MAVFGRRSRCGSGKDGGVWAPLLVPLLFLGLALVSLPCSAFAETEARDCRAYDFDGTGFLDRHDFRTLLHSARGEKPRWRRFGRFQRDLFRVVEFLRCARRGPVSHNVLVVGLDSARWELLDVLMEGGYVPTLRRLVEDGSRGAMWCYPSHPPTACFCPPVWTTLATGQVADRHGLLSFATPNTERRVKAIWDVLHEQGGTTTLSAYRHSWPPPSSADYVLTEQGATYLGSRMFVMFSSLFPFIRILMEENPTYVKPRELVDHPGLLPDEDEVLDLAWRPFAIDRASMRFMDLVTRERGTTDLTMILFHSPDKSSHVSWASIQDETGEALVEEAILQQAEDWRAPMVWLGNPASQYIEIDRWLGGFLERNHYSYVVFLSDHGMTRNRGKGLPGHHNTGLPDAHWGIFSVTGPGVRKGLDLGDLSLLDAVPTLSYLLGIPVSEELPGAVLEDAFTDRRLGYVPVATTPSWED